MGEIYLLISGVKRNVVNGSLVRNAYVIVRAYATTQYHVTPSWGCVIAARVSMERTARTRALLATQQNHVSKNAIAPRVKVYVNEVLERACKNTNLF